MAYKKSFITLTQVAGGCARGVQEQGEIGVHQLTQSPTRDCPLGSKTYNRLVLAVLTYLSPNENEKKYLGYKIVKLTNKLFHN